MSWRNTALTPTVLGIDARATSIALMIFLLHWSMWTFVIALVTISFFKVLEMRNLTINQAWRLFMSYVAGGFRPAKRLGRGQMRMRMSFLHRDVIAMDYKLGTLVKKK